MTRIPFTCTDCGQTTRSEGCDSCHQWWDVLDHPMHWDRLGVAISLGEWCELLEADDDYKRIASTHVGRWWISTVWLGIDGLVGLLHHTPMIFETMVFDQDGAPGDDFEQRRYPTEASARQGHDEMVQLVETLDTVGHHPDIVDTDPL